MAWTCFCAISVGLFCNNAATVVPGTEAERFSNVMAYILPALFLVFIVLLLGSELILLFKRKDANFRNYSLLGIVACVIATLLGCATFFGQCLYNYRHAGRFAPFPLEMSGASGPPGAS